MNAPSKRFDPLRAIANAANSDWTRPVLYVLATPHFAFFTSIWIALPWLALSLALEAAFFYAYRKSAGGDLRWRAGVMVLAVSLPWPWVVYAILLWMQNSLAAQAGALCAMFTSAMVGSLRPAADKRFLMATMAPPVFIVLAILAMAYARALPAPIIPIALCSALGITVVMLAAAEASYVNQQRLRQMRAELKAERDVLDARVRERTAQLEEAMTRAEAASRAKSQFIAAMSHELRTPLNAIIGFSEMAIDDIEAGRAASADDMARVRKAGAHLLGMINDVLDLAKAETDELGLTIAPADLGALIGAAVEAAKPAAAARSNSVELWIGAPLGLVSCDAGRFRRALDNLLSNACKFTRDGTIVVTAAREGGDLIVEVRDSGQGMTPDVMAHLFEPFVRGDSSATRAADGAGLGLVVTRNIARAMGGDLTAESAPGAGATFTLRLPIADKAEAKGQAAA